MIGLAAAGEAASAKNDRCESRICLKLETHKVISVFDLLGDGCGNDVHGYLLGQQVIYKSSTQGQAVSFAMTHALPSTFFVIRVCV